MAFDQEDGDDLDVVISIMFTTKSGVYHSVRLESLNSTLCSSVRSG